MSLFQVEKYKAIEKIGGGGMANIFLALNTETDEQVVLKVSLKSVQYAREALRNEFSTYNQLKHDCFPNVYELIEDESRLVMVMDYIEGSSLEEVLGQKTFDPSSSLKLMGKIAEAMQHAGECGVIHADLKPANILLQGDDVRIIDFGLASGASSMTAEDIKEIAGTLVYFSPEQADGRPLDLRSDIFSAGSILYELLTGERPFDSSYDMATLYSIMYEEPVPPSKLNTDLGNIVDSLVMGMLAKQPEDRYSDFSVVSDAIAAIGDSYGVEGESSKSSITVAPFQMRQAGADDDLLAEGLTEELIGLLSHLEDVDVTPLLIVKKKFTEDLTPEEVRTTLGTDFLLTGTIRRASGRVRVSTTLIDTVTSKIVCAEKYDSPMTDIFDLQDMICNQILDALKVTLTSDSESPKRVRATENVEAYEFYLKGRSYLTRNTHEDMEFAKLMLEKAIEIDPNYLLAHAGLADFHGSLYMNYFDRSAENWDQGIARAQRAIDIDGSNPSGFRAYGRLLHLHGRYDEAIEYLSRAVTIDANYGEAYRTLAWANEGKAALQEALSWTRKALSVDPQSEEAILLQGMLYYDLNNMPQAINAFMRCLELRPDYGRAHYFLAKSYQKMGRFEDAVNKYAVAMRFGGQPEIYLDYGWLLHCLGDDVKAISVLSSACEENQQRHMAHCYLGMTLQDAQKSSEAKEQFTKAIEASAKLISQGEEMSYPYIVKAISHLGLGEEDEADAHYYQVAKSPEVSDNGELALLCARYCARRGWVEETQKWLTHTLSWRLGISELEALIEPSFNEYHAYINSHAASHAA